MRSWILGLAAVALWTTPALAASGGLLEPNAIGQAFWTITIFIVLMAVLWKFAWPHILQALEEREARIKSDLEQAEQKRQESERVLAEHQQKLAAAQDDVQAIIAEARTDAERLKKEILEAAEAQAQSLGERAQRDIQAATDQALQQIWEQTANLATEVAERVIEKSMADEDHQRLIQQTLDAYAQSRN